MPATVGSFRGIKLTPGKPHSLRLAKGELYSLRQLALAKPGTKATVSLRTAGNPEVVVCALDVSAAQWTLELEVGAADEAVLVCKGSDVDVSGAVSLDDERPAASSVSAKRAAAAPFPPSKKARTQPEPGDEEDDGEDDGEDEDEEDEDEDEEDEDEEQQQQQRQISTLPAAELAKMLEARTVGAKPALVARLVALEDEAAGGDEEGEEEGSEEEEGEKEEEEVVVVEEKKEQPTASAAPPPPAAKGDDDELADMHLTCQDCRSAFVFTVDEQKAFLRYGYSIPRIRCKPCSDAKKMGNYDKSGRGILPGGGRAGGKGGGKGGASQGRGKGMGGKVTGGKGGSKGGGKGGGKGGVTDSRVCYAFQRGECSRGAACRFQH